ncbi:hypothetical protein QFC21_006124 [Naganishia friedmannii]|uniref:Uncharacterized protein n=1 Tax=Naganishia friedmannii TaxID=89922 RepID=A0ACC2V4A8_9TREE|nr:hypothetical protein QFC21_006124 [Naganishia friedmannii]
MDLKPNNVLIEQQGRLKLTDFGFAVRLPVPSRKGLWCTGTPDYRAMELWEYTSNIDSSLETSVDIWGVGLLPRRDQISACRGLLCGEIFLIQPDVFLESETADSEAKTIFRQLVPLIKSMLDRRTSYRPTASALPDSLLPLLPEQSDAFSCAWRQQVLGQAALVNPEAPEEAEPELGSRLSPSTISIAVSSERRTAQNTPGSDLSGDWHRSHLCRYY